MPTSDRRAAIAAVAATCAPSMAMGGNTEPRPIPARPMPVCAAKHRLGAWPMPRCPPPGRAHPGPSRNAQPHEGLMQDHLHHSQTQHDADRAQPNPSKQHRNRTDHPSQKKQHNRPRCGTSGRHVGSQRQDKAGDCMRGNAQPTQ